MNPITMQINHRRCGHIIETQIAPCASLIYFLLIWLYLSKIGYTMYQHYSLPITYILGVVLVFSFFHSFPSLSIGGVINPRHSIISKKEIQELLAIMYDFMTVKRPLLIQTFFVPHMWTIIPTFTISLICSIA